MDIIFLTDLRVETVIGIYDWEKAIRQTVAVDLEMGTDIRKAAATDDIEHTLNYKAISKRLTSHIEQSKVELIETLGEQIASILQNEFDVRWVKVTLHKPGAITGAADVGVIIERGNRHTFDA
jgi:dihydroneopterin aldolase